MNVPSLVGIDSKPIKWLLINGNQVMIEKVGI